MKLRHMFTGMLGMLILMGAAIAATQQAASPAKARPDLNGVWSGGPINGIDVSRTNGSDGSVYLHIATPPPGTPGAPRIIRSKPEYKEPYATKQKETDAHQSFVDKAFYCGNPGVPRMGPPQKIVQTANEVILLYQTYPSGDHYRIVPTDGRAHDDDADPSYQGDAVGHWQGNTLAIESINFVEDTWLGAAGYIHSSELKVTERFHREGGKLFYDVTVEDPVMLQHPWQMTPVTLTLSKERLYESLPCMDVAGPLLKNNDHHDLP